MKTLSLLLLGTLASPFALAEVASLPNANPTALAEQMHSARWPADIVRAADECLNRYPASACAAEAATARPAAARAAAILALKQVTLYRSSFADPRLGADMQQDLHQAALGDAHAATRIADTYAHGPDASLADQHRYVGWLQYAAELGNEVASYELALHFRYIGEPAIAAVYESRATQLGYVPPLALDNIRK